MNTRIRAVALSLLILAAGLSALCGTATAASAVSPLPPSDYTVRPVCPAPAPRHASCLALRLVARTAAARAHTHPLGITRSAPIRAASAKEGAFGLRPQDLHSVYRLPSTAPSTQTIAIVDAYNDLSAAADLSAYDAEFGLPDLPTCTNGGASACFEKVNQHGETGNLPFPQSEASRIVAEAECSSGLEPKAKAACEALAEAAGWAGEIALDIEVAHATCQNCRIALVEADSASFFDLEAAEGTAAALGATEISNSWGGPEQGMTPALDNASAFNLPGIAVTAASGDDGYLDWHAEPGATKGFAEYPASSPHVVAVGGTRLQIPLGAGRTWAGETVWNGNGAGGSGCSVEFVAQPWQQNVIEWSSVGCGSGRAVADVSADADPYTGVAVYSSTFECQYEESKVIHVVHWCTIGGTSLASPIVASVFALGGGAYGVEYPAKTLYENELQTPGSLHDITLGSNGECSEPFNEKTGVSGCTELQEAASCSKTAICVARNGYDGPTGVGTPDGIAAFQPPVPAGEGEPEGGSKGGNGLSEVGAGPTSSQPAAVPSSVTVTAGAPSTGSPQSPSTSAAVPILSATALTRGTIAALHRLGEPPVSRVAFTFTLNMAARVRVTLAKQIVARGRKRWQTLPVSLTIVSAAGRTRARLSAPGRLAPGRYRLTLKPAHGTARTLTFSIR